MTTETRLRRPSVALSLQWVYCQNAFCRPDGNRRKLFQAGPTLGGKIQGVILIKCDCGAISHIDLSTLPIP